MPAQLLINDVDQTGRLKFPTGGFTLPVAGKRGTSQFTIQCLLGDSYIPAVGDTIKWIDNYGTVPGSFGGTGSMFGEGLFGDVLPGAFDPGGGGVIGGTTVFRGSIDSVQAEPIDDLGGFLYQVACVSTEQRFDKRFITKAYAAGETAGSIFTDILTNVVNDEGLTIGTIATGVVMFTNKVYENARVSDVFNELTRLSGDFVWYIQNDTVYFTATSATVAPFIVTESMLLVNPRGTIKTNRADYRNTQHVKISEAKLSPLVAHYSGDGITTVFNVSQAIREIVSISRTTASPGTVTGTFSGVPNDGDIVNIGSYTYTFRADNTTAAFNQADAALGVLYALYVSVFIGADANACAINLAAAINAGAGRGTLYSSYANASTVASATTSGGVITLISHSTGGIAGILPAESSANFVWNLGTSGVDGSSLSESFADNSSTISGSQWTYDPGGTAVTQASTETPIAVGETLTITYRQIGFGFVTVKNSVEIASRQAIEGGSGVYENINTRQDIYSLADGIAAAQALLDAYGSIPQVLTFQTDTFGLLPGQLANIACAAYAVSANYLIQNVTAGTRGTDITLDGFRYTITAVSASRLQTQVDFWQTLRGVGVTGPVSNTFGASSSGSGPGTVTTGGGTTVTTDGVIAYA